MAMGLQTPISIHFWVAVGLIMRKMEEFYAKLKNVSENTAMLINNCVVHTVRSILKARLQSGKNFNLINTLQNF